MLGFIGRLLLLSVVLRFGGMALYAHYAPQVEEQIHSLLQVGNLTQLEHQFQLPNLAPPLPQYSQRIAPPAADPFAEYDSTTRGGF